MSELVDKQAVLRAISELSFVGYLNADDMHDAVEWLPTIDAVEVVRCKDCKWGERYGTTDEGKPYYYCVITDWAGQPPKFFCADGVRKETDDE